MLRRVVFSDTSALYALFSPNDSLKLVSSDILKELLDVYNVELVTTNFVQYECLSKLKKHGLDCCKKFDQLISRNILTVNKVNDKLLEQGLEIFWTYQDKTWGVVDCVSIKFMWESNIFYVFALDEHFQQAGLFPLLKYDSSSHPIKTYSSLTFP